MCVEWWSCYSVRCRGAYSHDLGVDKTNGRHRSAGNLGVHVMDVRQAMGEGGVEGGGA